MLTWKYNKVNWNSTQMLRYLQQKQHQMCLQECCWSIIYWRAATWLWLPWKNVNVDSYIWQELRLLYRFWPQWMWWKRPMGDRRVLSFIQLCLCVSPPGTVPVALAMGACVLALLSLPLILVLVYRQRQGAQSSRRMYYWCVQMSAHTPAHTPAHTNKHTHTHFHFHALSSNTNLSLWVPNSGLSNTYFLSLSWINCISYSRKHIHTRPVAFRCVSLPSQWPVSCFLSPRCTGAGEDGQVSFPTGRHTAGSPASKHSC